MEGPLAMCSWNFSCMWQVQLVTEHTLKGNGAPRHGLRNDSRVRNLVLLELFSIVLAVEIWGYIVT